MGKQAFICDSIRTPFGHYTKAFPSLSADRLGAMPIKSLMARNASVDWAAISDLIYERDDHHGRDDGDLVGMGLQSFGLPAGLPGMAKRRLHCSGMHAIGLAAGAIREGHGEFIIAGGTQATGGRQVPVHASRRAGSPTRGDDADSRRGATAEVHVFEPPCPIEPLPDTAERVACEHGISREAQDRMAEASQHKAVAARRSGFFDDEITPIDIQTASGRSIRIAHDQQPRETCISALARLSPLVRPRGTVTAGNASGINDGACAVLLAEEGTVVRRGLTPMARVLGVAWAAMSAPHRGIGPAPASQKVLSLTGLRLDQMDVIELSEDSAAQGLAIMRALGIRDDDPRVNPNGGAIALGNPLAASGARLVATAVRQLIAARQRYALCTTSIGRGDAVAIVLERV